MPQQAENADHVGRSQRAVGALSPVLGNAHAPGPTDLQTQNYSRVVDTISR